jgi:hypothetical protein
MGINSQYKDSVFSLLFSDPDVLRELYCALENVTLPPDTPVIINTLQNVLFMDSINDISFVIGGRLVVLVEHQSSINPNMGLRFLMYIAKIYETMNKNRTLYSTKLMRIPRPEFFVLYNGLAPFPDELTLKLSDAFLDMGELGLTAPHRDAIRGPHSHGSGASCAGRSASSYAPQEPALELTVRVLNINDGRNAELLSSCKALGEYSEFVAQERSFEQQLGDRQKAMQAAVRYCLDRDILRSFMEKHSREVLRMRITEWNTEEAIAVWREEGVEEGLERGREEGQKKLQEQSRETARKLKALGVSAEHIIAATGLSADELE